MEKITKCHICGTENKHEIWTEAVGVVEEYYYCEKCGYFMEMAYSPIHEGIDLFSRTKIFDQLLTLFKHRDKLRGLKIGKPHF